MYSMQNINREIEFNKISAPYLSFEGMIAFSFLSVIV
jgi:hypothetical protein